MITARSKRICRSPMFQRNHLLDFENFLKCVRPKDLPIALFLKRQVENNSRIFHSGPSERSSISRSFYSDPSERSSIARSLHHGLRERSSIGRSFHSGPSERSSIGRSLSHGPGKKILDRQVSSAWPEPKILDRPIGCTPERFDRGIPSHTRPVLTR